MNTSLEIRYVLEKEIQKSCKTSAQAKLSSSFFLVTRNNADLFVLPFYRLDKKYKIHRLIHDSGSKMAV